MTADDRTAELAPDPSGPAVVRRTAGVVAVSLSVLLHIGLGIAASRITVTPGRPARSPTEHTRASIDLRMRPELDWAAVEADVLEELRGLTTVPEIPLEETAQTLAPDADTARLMPSALPPPEALTGDDPLEPPRAMPDRAEWQPRQEVLALESRLLESRPEDTERPMIPAVDRVSHAPDIVLPMPPAARLPHDAPAAPMTTPDPIQIVAVPEAPAATAPPDDVTRVEQPPGTEEGTGELFEEDPEEVSPPTPIEELLTARVTTYRRLRDFRHGYFRLEIDRIDADRVPRIPKDIVFVQDSSASMSELRLAFCRRALARAIGMLHPDDRFNVVDFSDRVVFCFDTWRSPDPASIAQATAFINAMRADGDTDLYASMSALLELDRDPARPVIAVVITDGIPTTGVMDSSDIIGRFSLLNQGRISLYTFGVMTLSNYYLLDLLSYSNRGDVRIVEGGRFGIEAGIVDLMESINRPAVSDLDFYFSRRADIEVYPIQTANLYVDRPLVLYGRYRRDVPRVVFQAVGAAGERSVDMIFSLPFDDDAVAEGESDIRDNWARQKLYHLIAKHARTQDPALLEEIRATARSYRVDIPHQQRLF